MACGFDLIEQSRGKGDFLIINPRNFEMAASRYREVYAEVMADAKVIWDAIHRLKGPLQSEWNAGDYGNTLPDGSDLQGAGDQFAGITNAQVGAVVFASADALKTALDTVAGNMQKLL
jgi:hypothetical protein